MRNLWNQTLGKLYYNAFKRHFELTISRLTKLAHDFHNIDKRLAELDVSVHVLLEAAWQEKALARRLAAIEDRLETLADQGSAPKADSTKV